MNGQDASEDAQLLFRLSNEFAFVEVSLVRFGNGERLLVSSPSRGTAVHLDPVVLDVLSAASPEDLARLVAGDLDR